MIFHGGGGGGGGAQDPLSPAPSGSAHDADVSDRTRGLNVGLSLLLSMLMDGYTQARLSLGCSSMR